MATYAATQEVYSFVAKFNQLAGSGVNSCLNLNNSNGKLYVTLSAEVHELPLPGSLHSVPSYCKKMQPSRVRRRKRREALRKATEVNLELNANNTENVSSNDSQVLDSHDEISQSLNENHEPSIELKHGNAEEELVNCRSVNEELTSKIGAFELEIQKKEHKIRKLELDVSKLEFSSFKPPKKLSIANVQRTDIPPSFP